MTTEQPRGASCWRVSTNSCVKEPGVTNPTQVKVKTDLIHPKGETPDKQIQILKEKKKKQKNNGGSYSTIICNKQGPLIHKIVSGLTA